MDTPIDMVVRTTRSKHSITPGVVEAAQETKISTLVADQELHQVLLLPANASEDARVISLPHPRTGSAHRYLFCPKTGLYEFTKIGSPRDAPRSFLVAPHDRCTTISAVQQMPRDNSTDPEALHPPHAPFVHSAERNTDGRIIESGDILIVTSFDPILLLLPLFQSGSGTHAKGSGSQSFREADDLLEILVTAVPALGIILRSRQFKDSLIARLHAVSEVREVGDAKFYRPDTQRLLEILLAKAKRVVSRGNWPRSMEESQVRRPLETPCAIVANQPADGMVANEENGTSADRESQILANDSSSGRDVSNDVNVLQRISTVLKFIFNAYIPKELCAELTPLVQLNKGLDFAPLDTHLKKIQNLQTEALALRALSDNVSRKRGAADDDEAAEARLTQKRKKDEEIARKKTESRGIRVLKKVNTSAMQKLSSFFSKPLAKAQ